MSKEKPDEFLSWRGRLNRPEALPEQGVEDRELSWEKLAERLREKPGRRRTAYWIAAACLLLALVPVAHLFHDRRTPLALHSPVRPQARPEKVAAASAAAPASRATPAPDKVLASRTGIQTVPGRTRYFHRAAAAVPPPLARLEDRRPSIAGPSITEPVIQAAADTVNRLIAQRPVPKKPVRIVSLNEINKEGSTPAMSTGRTGFLHIGQGILGKGLSPDPASRQDQDKDYLLKINLSSQNR
jgi:hypothetical protein